MVKDYELICDDFENIENFEKALADNFKGWICHHRLGTHTSDGERRLVDIEAEELRALNMYYHRPAEELIFLTRSEHASLHSKGRHHTEEAKKKIGEAQKGQPAWNKGKSNVYTQESLKKMSDAMKRNPSLTGRHWYNNGEVNKACFECPPGYVPGKIHHKNKKSKGYIKL